MIDSRFFRSAALLLLFTFAPPSKSDAAEFGTRKADDGFYGKIFNVAKLSGESNFMDTGRAAVNAFDDMHTASPDGYHNGAVIREYRPTHDFNVLGVGFAVGYRNQETRVEFEALINGAGNLASTGEELFYGIADIPADKATSQNKLTGVAFAAVGPMKFSNFSYTAGLLNLYQHFGAGKMVKLFIGGGVGLAKVNYHLSEGQELASMPIITQGKVGLTFDIEHLRGIGAVPYLGYTARYFVEQKAETGVTGLNVIRTGTSAVLLLDAKIANSPVEGVNFVPIATHLLHNIELGFSFSIDT